MIDPGQRVETLYLRGLPLLPVHPPKVHSILLHRVVEQLKIVLDEPFVGNAKGNRCAAGGIHPHRLGKAGIDLLERLHPLGWVQVEGDTQAPIVHPLEKGGRVGEELAVPGVAGPSVRRVPVHINDQHVQRQVV